MNDKTWVEQYKHWKPNLKPFQIKLLEEGATTQSQQWLLNSMWSDWNEIQKLKESEQPSITPSLQDPWDDELAC